MTPTKPHDLDELEARSVSRSVVEEVVGILWAILATLTSSKFIMFAAWGMAGISFAGAIYFAIRTYLPGNDGRRG